MNPFVGLSKVTKKRLDALENIIKEVDGVKTRIGDLELNLEKNGATTKTEVSSVPIKSPVNTKASVEAPQAYNEPIIHMTIPQQNILTEHFNAIGENDIDTILNKSLDSLLVEQNIESMINEFFITLK